ncbi:hypothetical protein NUBL21994_45500 [Klebsiella pneumoniae]|nr:hypothetical protein NUBL21994_45500 [Klebsiella pneumoniae]
MATNMLSVSVSLSLPSLKRIVFRGYGSASDLLSDGVHNAGREIVYRVGIMALNLSEF